MSFAEETTSDRPAGKLVTVSHKDKTRTPDSILRPSTGGHV